MRTLLVGAKRCGECGADSPTHIESRDNRRWLDADLAAPISHGHVAPGVHDSSVITAVVRLLYRCCPTAIARLVVSVHVFSLERMSRRRASSDVRQEALEAIRPSLTHRDAAGAIEPVRAAATIEAAHLRPNPSSVFAGLLLTDRLAVGQASRAHVVALKTSTAFDPTCRQVTRSRNRGIAAIALARPVDDVSLTTSRSADDYESSKSLPGPVDALPRHAEIKPQLSMRPEA